MIKFYNCDYQLITAYDKKIIILINRLINFVIKKMDKEKTDKKDHILDVAEKIFSEHGFDGASTRFISGEANVNMAMLNYYFGSKEGLFLSVIERKITTFQDILQNIGDDDSISAWYKVEKYVDLYIERVVNKNHFQKLIYQEMAMNRRSDLADKIRGILMINVFKLKKILQEGIDKGEFKPNADTEMVVATLYGTRNYVLNLPLMTNAMLGYDIEDEKILEEKFKPRLKLYMKHLLKSYLQIEHEYTS